MTPSLFLLILAIFFVFWIRDFYERLSSLREETEAAWNRVEKGFEKRDELIASFVQVICEEQEKREDLAALVWRQRGGSPFKGQVLQVLDLEERLKKKMEALYREAKQSPSPPSEEEVGEMRVRLAASEMELSERLEDYNELASAYNYLQRRLPGPLFAPLFDHSPADLQEN